MQTNHFDNPENLANHIAWLANPSTSWEDEGVNLSDLDELIKNNMRLIIEQIENPETAPSLEKSLLALSERLSKEQNFDTPEGRDLAFEVTSIAIGILSSADVDDVLELQTVSQLNSDLFENAESLTRHMAWLAKPSTSWKKEGIDFSYLNELIKNNRRLIVKQTEDSETAPKLQKSLFDLSKRMETELDTPEGHHLAFEVSTVALGIFPIDGGAKPEWTDLPQDVLKVILSKNLQKNSLLSGLEDSTEVSKEWKESAEIVKQDWTACQTAEEAVQCIIDNGLLNANLEKFTDITNEDLTKLVESCPKLNSLGVVFDGGIDFPLENLTNLKTLRLVGRHIREGVLSEGLQGLKQLNTLILHTAMGDEDNWAEALKSLPKLTQLDVSDSRGGDMRQLPGALENLPELTVLKLRDCEIPGDTLAAALKKLPKLTVLNLTRCDIFKGELPETLKGMSQLTTLHLTQCVQFPEKELAEALKGLSQLTYLNLAGCIQIRGNELFEVLKNLPHLTTLDLNNCPIVDPNEISRLRAAHPNINIYM